MKNLRILAVVVAAAMLAGCEKVDLSELDEYNKKEVTFKVKGDFGQMTRATTAVGESSMSDVWVLDYVDGVLAQQVHQESVDTDFGSPTLSLTLGSHEIYFVASAGGSPVLNTDAHKITWGTPRDTFWKKVSKNVASNTGGSATVTLDRVATRLSINVEDEIPTGMAQLLITPSTWYYGLDYLTGNATDVKANEVFTITIPASYAGRTNTKVAIFGLSLAEEWTTNATVTAKDGEGNVLSTESISGAPMQKNRSTDYTGTLFLSENVYGVSVDDTWGTSYNGTW